MRGMWRARGCSKRRHSARSQPRRAGVAFSLGYPDGQKISREEMLARAGRIARAVKVPVTADVEAGYGFEPEDAARTATEVIAAGVVGMNLEDATGDPAHPLVDLPVQLERIRAVKAAALKTGVLLVLNARTDVYLAEGRGSGHALRRVGAAVTGLPGCGRRLRVFAGRGRSRDDRKYCARCEVPSKHSRGGPGSPTIAELQDLGVARVSIGSSAMRATLGLVERIAEELKTAGTYTSLEGGTPYADVNRMLGELVSLVVGRTSSPMNEDSSRRFILPAAHD